MLVFAFLRFGQGGQQNLPGAATDKHPVGPPVEQPGEQPVQAGASPKPASDNSSGNSSGSSFGTSLPLRVCSQNIFRLGAPDSAPWNYSRGASRGKKNSRPKDSKEKQRDYLVERMKRAQCDVVAMQEVPAGPDAQSDGIANELAEALGSAAGEPFRALLARGSDGHIKNGFLVRENAGRVISVGDLEQSLPRLQRSPGPRGYFGRAPLVLLFEFKPAVDQPARRVLFITLHFKSRRNSSSDPTRTQFEALRLEMAEAIRTFALAEVSKHPGTAVVVLGDRNSATDSGSADVLTGERELEDFRDGNCRIDQGLHAECDSMQGRPKALVGLFEYRNELFPQRYREGSFMYRKQQELIDEILVRPTDLPLVQGPDSTLAIGLEGEFYKGSDHRLLWAEFNWKRQ